MTSSRYLQTRGINSATDYPATTIGVLRQTINELGALKGIQSLYRGYCCYMLAIMFWMSALPAATDFWTNAIPYAQEFWK